jgi:hypothetical protein
MKALIILCCSIIFGFVLTHFTWPEYSEFDKKVMSMLIAIFMQQFYWNVWSKNK